MNGDLVRKAGRPRRIETTAERAKRELPEYVEAKSFAKFLALNEKTFRRQLKMQPDAFPSPLPRIDGGRIRFLRDEIVDWFQTRSQTRQG